MSKKDEDPALSPRLQVHAYAAEFPMLGKAGLAELADKIKTFGQIHPIILSDDRKILLDGRNRLAACKIAGKAPVWETFSDFVNRKKFSGSIMDMIDQQNNVRRMVGPVLAQRLALLRFEHARQEIENPQPLVEIEDDFENADRVDLEAALEAPKGKAKGKAAAKPKAKSKADPDPKAKPESMQDTVAKIASESGISVEQLERQRRIKKARPDLWEKVGDDDGQITVNAAYQIMMDDAKTAKEIEDMEAAIDVLNALPDATEQFVEAVERGELLKNSREVKSYCEQDEETRKHIAGLLAKQWAYGAALKYSKTQIDGESSVKDLCGVCTFHGGKFSAEIGEYKITVEQIKK